MYKTIYVNYEAKIKAEAGTGAGPKWRLRLQPNTSAPGCSGRLRLRVRNPATNTSPPPFIPLLGTQALETDVFLLKNNKTILILRFK